MTDPAETPEVKQIAEGFYVRQAVDNMAWVDLGGEAVVIDTLEHAFLEDEIISSITDTLGHVPVRWIFNTHTHFDHVALNNAIRRRWVAEVVNRNTTNIPDEGTWFEGSNRKVLMQPIRSGHSDSDCIFWFPEDRVLFTGDVFGWGMIPLTRGLNQNTARQLMMAYEHLISFDAEVVVPGHGVLCSTAELRRFVDFFNDLVEEVRRQVEKGVEIISVSPPEDMLHWWRFVQWKHENSFERIVKAVRAGSL
jgi:glyoxylase-like metal-dependent hydrolase (beta-lactamase superfamily II)